jgi:hypothetical protein
MLTDFNNSGNLNNIDLELPAVLESSTYDYGRLGSKLETYSSSEGKLGDSSIYDPGHSSWNNIPVDDSCYYSDDVDIDDNLNPDKILLSPHSMGFNILRVTESPGSPSPAQPDSESQLVDTAAYNVPVRDLKQLRAPVAADLDTANTLPSQHRCKRT